MSVRIVVRQDEPISLLWKRFTKQLERAGVSWELRRRRYFVNGTQIRRAKQFQKRFKTRQANLVAKMSGKVPVASLKEEHAEFWRRTGKP